MAAHTTTTRVPDRRKGPSFLRWALVGGVWALVLAAMAFRLAQALPQIALSQVERMTRTTLACASFKVRPTGSVVIRDLTIHPRDPHTLDSTILRAGQVHVRFSLWSLLLLRPRVKGLTIQDFVLEARLDQDTGQWNIGTVAFTVPPATGRRGMPEIHLTKGMIRYVRLSAGREVEVAAIPVDAHFTLDRRTDRGYTFEVTTEEILPGLGCSVLSGTWRPGRVLITGGLKSREAPSTEQAFAVNTMALDLGYAVGGDYTLEASVRDLFSSHSPDASVFALIQSAFLGPSNPVARIEKFFGRFDPSGKADIRVRAEGNLSRLMQSRCQGTIECTDVSIRDRRFPYALDHVTGQIAFTEDSFQTKRLAGRHGDVEVLIDFWTSSAGPEWQYEVRVASTRMPLDQDLLDALSPRQRSVWSAFDPHGTIAVQYEAQRQSALRMRESLLVKPLETAATYAGFPYPLTNLTGEILFEEDRVVLSNLVSKAEGTGPIRLDGTVAGLDSNSPAYDLTIRAQAVPLDETLAASLGPSRRSAYDPLKMAGSADAHIKVFTDLNEPPPDHVGFRAEVSLQDVSLSVFEGRVRLTHSNGRAVLTPGSVTVQDLACLYGQAAVCLSGEAALRQGATSAGDRWTVQAQRVPVEDLLTVLPDSSREAVQRFHPSGLVDVGADLDKAGPLAPLRVTAKVQCLENRIRADAFPYPLRDLTGTITVTPERILLEGLRARPDANTPPGLVQASGSLEMGQLGVTSVDLGLTAEDIRVDTTLEQALPGPLAESVGRWDPSGLVCLTEGRIHIDRPAQGPWETHFEGQVRLDPLQMDLLGTPAA
nr:hypothetical protein [Phycisphaerae bacterium]